MVIVEQTKAVITVRDKAKKRWKLFIINERQINAKQNE